MEFCIEEELKKLPHSPGVYIMHDARDEIIYVGKAISLRNRVRQYFQTSYNKSPKIQQMVSLINRFEYIMTDSELEALVLENNLIKEHRPKYNTMLKDDKTYPYIKVTVGEEFPRIFLTRQMKKDKARYFGPFSSAGAVRDTLDLLHRTYMIRSCDRVLPRDAGKERPCLNYHIHMCDGPCTGCVSVEEYRKRVDKALTFLNGDFDPTIESIRSQMEAASEELDFEAAAGYRDLLNSVLHVAQKQKITSDNVKDHDVIAMKRDDSDAVVQVFFIRDGKMVGREHHYVKVALEESPGLILDSFVKQFYEATPLLPREIWLQHEIEDAELIERWLSEKRGGPVSILVPKIGEKHRMIELAEKNAEQVLVQDSERIKRDEARSIGAVHEIEKLLGLAGIRRMEAYDISNTSGIESVGSMVVYEDGKPKTHDYRKFRIKTVLGPNDYASMKEVLTRRFTHESEAGDTGFGVFPDLIMMDGGRGQVNIALEVLDSLGIRIPVCGMVKDDQHRTRGLYYNNIEVPIDTRSEGFKLITRIQDEAHRFAIEYHRSLRGKAQVHSVLDDIKGIGPVRRRALMKHFRTVEEIRSASEEELAQVEGMDRGSAAAVYSFFRMKEE